MYDPVTGKLLISRDVVFDEDEHWDWDTSNSTKPADVLEWGNENELMHSKDIEESSEEEEQGGEQASSSSALPLYVPTESPIQASPNQGRTRREPVWMQDYVSGEGLSDEEEGNLVMFTEAGDPTCFEEANQSAKWREAMDAEIKAIEKNETWELTVLPEGAKKVGVKWLFKTKVNENGEVEKHKARLVAKGYTQKFGIDYTEVFAPVARWDTIKMILALAAHEGWTIYQLDVKSAFMHGELSETVFVEQPHGYEKKGEEDKVYKLRKALYGLK